MKGYGPCEECSAPAPAFVGQLGNAIADAPLDLYVLVESKTGTFAVARREPGGSWWAYAINSGCTVLEADLVSWAYIQNKGKSA